MFDDGELPYSFIISRRDDKAGMKATRGLPDHKSRRPSGVIMCHVPYRCTRMWQMLTGPPPDLRGTRSSKELERE